MNSDRFSPTQSEIRDLEERLRQAELGPDPAFCEEYLDDKMVMVAEDGKPQFAKPMVMKAHQPGNGPKFTRVEMSEMQIVDHGSEAVVTCKGTYEHAKGVVSLNFMRVWAKKNGSWKVIAGSVLK